MIDIYCKSIGKVFPITCICTSVAEANNFCEKHKNSGVIAENNGLIFIAELYSITLDSKKLADVDTKIINHMEEGVEIHA